jgi:hypothetical protein
MQNSIETFFYYDDTEVCVVGYAPEVSHDTEEFWGAMVTRTEATKASVESISINRGYGWIEIDQKDRLFRELLPDALEALEQFEEDELEYEPDMYM